MTYSTLRRSTPMKRGGPIKRKTRLRVKRNPNDYGRAKGSAETWPQFKARILARDNHRCVVWVCGTPEFGVTVHHRIRVGSGGKNDDTNCASVCANCHVALHDYFAPNAAALIGGYVDAYMTNLYAVVLSRDEQEDAEEFPTGYCAALSPVDGRAPIR